MDELYENYQNLIESSKVGENEKKFVKDKSFDFEFFKKVAPRCFTHIKDSGWTFELKMISLDKLGELLSYGLFDNVHVDNKNFRKTRDRQLLSTVFDECNIDHSYMNFITCHRNNRYSIKISHLSLPKVKRIIEFISV